MIGTSSRCSFMIVKVIPVIEAEVRVNVKVVVIMVVAELMQWWWQTYCSSNSSEVVSGVLER